MPPNVLNIFSISNYLQTWHNTAKLEQIAVINCCHIQWHRLFISYLLNKLLSYSHWWWRLLGRYHLQEKSCEVSIIQRECIKNWHIYGIIYYMQVWKKTVFNQGQLLLYSSICMSLIFNLTRVCKKKKKKFINKLRGFTKFFKWWDFGHA